MITGAQIAAEARAWIGVPFVHQGRTRSGVDCVGLVLCVREAIEPWPLARSFARNYARCPKDALLHSIVAEHTQQIDAPEEGCMILVKWPSAVAPTHAVIYSNGNIIHAYQRVKRVVETGFRAHWAREAHSFWRLPGVQP